MAYGSRLKSVWTPAIFKGDVYAAVLAVLVTGDNCAGDNRSTERGQLSVGETVYSSPIIAAAQSVTGVVAVKLQTFERMDSPTRQEAAHLRN